MSELKQSSVALLEKAIDDKIRKSQSKRDTTLATVTRVDNDGTTWVHVYGGADETPVRHMTSSAQVGDIINVTFSGLSCSGIGNVTSPSASQKQVQQVSAENAQAIRGVMEGLLQVKTVVAQKVSTRELDAEMATIISAAIDNATINALNAKYANINQIEAAYAKIDGANINTAAIRNAWVNNLLVETNLLANDGTVFTLDAVQVDAANITTGTLDVRRLIVTRTIDGVDQKFVVNFDTSGNVTYTKLDGDVLGPQTVAAEKLVAHSITAEQLTIQNIVGTDGWINLANGTFAYGNPLTGQGITWDGSSLNISGSVRIGSSSKALSDMLTADDVTVTQNQTQTGYDVDIAGNTFSLVNGEDGQPGATGPQGQTGPTAQWYYGTALTHTSGTAAISTSGTADVVVGSMYLNTELTLCYKCTAISGSTATWAYAGNLTDGVIENVETYVDDAVGAANQLEQTVYIQATAGTTTAAPPSGWVEETGESTYLVETGGTEAWSTPVWTTKPPTYRQQYPVTLVAIQRKRIDGTVTCTAPLIDDTTTVIDGGNIITDSVTANAIDATDLHVSAANVDGTLTASQIDTEGIELDMSAITGLGNELDGLSDQIERKASTEDVESLSATVGSMSDTVETALGEGGTVEKLRSDMDTIQAHISLGTIGEGSSMQPAITLDAEGGSSDGFKNVITNTSMSFMYGDETVAEVNKDELDITRTKVTESMQLGNFMWIPLSDGSLAFKWVEE